MTATTKLAKLEATLAWLYAHEINACVSSFWDGGWTFALGIGDPIDDPIASTQTSSLGEGAAFLIKSAMEAFPSLASEDVSTLFVGDHSGMTDADLDAIEKRAVEATETPAHRINAGARFGKAAAGRLWSVASADVPLLVAEVRLLRAKLCAISLLRERAEQAPL